MSTGYTKHDICRLLVQREVIHNASLLISHLAQSDNADGVDYDDDILPLLEKRQFTHEFDYECGCGHSWSIPDDEPQDLIEYDDVDTSQHCANCHECNEVVEPSDIRSEDADDSCEVFEYWIVTQWFAAQLAAHGEVVGEVLDFHIWGRTTTGQAIAIDGIIERIAHSMEILPGQAHEWSK